MTGTRRWEQAAGGTRASRVAVAGGDETATLLIVDDTPTNLQVLLDALESAGFDVLVATSGQQALERAKLGSPDLILLDVVMPGMDGFETCRQLKSTAGLSDTPVIFMTASDETGDKLKGFNAGAVDYVTKPLDHDEVLVRLRTHLALRRLHRELHTQNLQLGAITEALTRFLRTDRSDEAVGVLLDSAVTQTASDFGIVGVLSGDETPDKVSVLAMIGVHERLGWDRPFFDAMRDSLTRVGHADYTRSSLEPRIGQVLANGETVSMTVGAATGATNDPAVHVLSVPMIVEDDVVGFVTVFRGAPEYERAETELLERFARASAAVVECERLRQLRNESESRRARAEEQASYLREEIKTRHNFDEIVGDSAALRQVLQQVERVAKTDSTVMIHGETGTGKELIARAIHNASPRAERPLISVSCAALPEGLVESELFGHEKGSFTGATAQRKGRFELADGGTLFLDEIGDMPLPAQTKLLRVLQEQVLERVGSSSSIKIDVRVLAATHRDLAKRVEMGEFRQDLYYRLNVFPMELPPLRERPEDIPALVNFFARRFAAKMGLQLRGVSQATIERLQRYACPGNVRELENIVERAVILSTGELLEVPPELLPKGAVAPAPVRVERRSPASDQPVETREEGAPHSRDNHRTLEDVEREHVLQVLERCDWTVAGEGGAADVLGLKPSTLRNRMTKLGIRKPPSAD
ncbi:MAG: sigma 54-interacting transcriptional regulator [Gammaproteobacteria bacterium]